MIPKLIIHSDPKEREKSAEEFIKNLGFNKNHPDLMWLGPDEKLGIETARKIIAFLNLKAYQAKGQVVIIICAENLTLDAQNALLKTLEEHSGEVSLLLGAESEEQLLPTLLSRCQTVNLQIGGSTSFESETLRVDDPGVELKYQEEIEKLLGQSMADRFKYIEGLKEKDEFLQNLTDYFRHQLLNKSAGVRIFHPKGGNIDFLKDLIEAERWNKANVNLRAILEYLMLKMPQVKQ